MKNKENPFNYFQKIFCINLDSRPDRWTQVQNEFKKLGLQDRVERMSGVTNKQFPHYGCRDAMINCIKKAKELDLDNILIFEDDLVVLERDMNYYRNLIGELQKIPDWHLFYFSATMKRKPVPYNKYLFYADGILALHAHAVSRNVYDRILKDYKDGVIKIIDTYYRSKLQPQRKSFLATRFCATQADGFSDIKNRQASRDFIRKRYNKYVLHQYRDWLV